jgi:hypothetical protein
MIVLRDDLLLGLIIEERSDLFVIRDYCGSDLCPSSYILKKTEEQRFGYWICFHPQVRG